MADPSIPREELDLRRRARRRLVGAIALALLTVVLLPMVLDPEPQPLGDKIDIRIPDQKTAFEPSAAPAAVLPVPALETSPDGTAQVAVNTGDDTLEAPTATAPEPVMAEDVEPIPLASAPAVPVPAPVSGKPAVTKPGQADRADTKPAVSKPAETRPAETRPAETRPAETRPTGSRQAEARSVSPKEPAKPKPVQVKAAAAEPTATRPPTPATSQPVTKPPSPSTAPSYHLQLGVFSSQDNADQMVARARAIGFKASQSLVNGQYKVRVGPIPGRELALVYQARLKSKGVNNVLVEP